MFGILSKDSVGLVYVGPTFDTQQEPLVKYILPTHFIWLSEQGVGGLEPVPCPSRSCVCGEGHRHLVYKYIWSLGCCAAWCSTPVPFPCCSLVTLKPLDKMSRDCCYCVELSNARINWFGGGFFLSTSHLWNSLPSSVFLASFNLPSFKRQVCHSPDGMIFFSITPF